jgi:hypothetical protein
VAKDALEAAPSPPKGETRAAAPAAPAAPVYRAVGTIQHGARGLVVVFEPGQVIPDKVVAELRDNGLSEPTHFTST